MANNAYDTPLACLQMFLRTGEERYWKAGMAAALHTSDIDVVHYSTQSDVEVGGIRIHGKGHVQYNAEAVAGSSVVPSHEWAEGLLMAYHLTGEEDRRELALGVADHVLRALDAGWILPPLPARWHGARNLGWPLYLLTVVYDETGELMYITHPDYRSPYRQMPWGGFFYGYLLTRERGFLDFPLPLVLKLLERKDFGTFGEGAFSYPMRGLLGYLHCAHKAGILRDLPEF